MDSTLIPNGTIVVALRNITMDDDWPPLIYARDELRVVGYAVDRTENGVPEKVSRYRVETHRCIHVYVNPEDIEVKPLLPSRTEPVIPENVKQKIQEAFREGYSRGHSRGVNCGRLYGLDEQYSTIIQVETNSYLEELDDESNR